MKDELLNLDVEDFWDTILADDTIVELDCDWLNQCIERAKKIESDISIKIVKLE